MAKIRLPEVPQAPGVGSPPQPTNYPIPDIYKRQPANPKLPDITTKARLQAPQEINPRTLESPLDIEGKISQLMQSEIDPGPYLAAGKASVRAAESIGIAGRSMGSAIAELGQSLQVSKDNADISRFHNGLAFAQAAYEEAAVSVPLSERQKLWDEEFKPQVDALVGAMKPSAYVLDRIAPEWQLAQIKQRTKINSAARDEMIKGSTEAIMTDLEHMVSIGDWIGSKNANARLTQAKLQTPSQHAARELWIEEQRQAWNIQQLINTNPRAALQELDEIDAGEKSESFPDLKNPATIARARGLAREQINKREIGADEKIRLGIDNGKIKTRADIEQAAAGNLTEEHIQSYERILRANPEYSSEAVVKARTNAENYKPEEDPDLSKRRALIEQIATTVSKPEQKPIMEILDNRMKGTKGDQDPPQWYFSSLMKQVEELTKNGYFDPKIVTPGMIWGTNVSTYDRKKAESDPLYALAHKDIESASWTRAKAIQDSMRQWAIAHPDASPKEAQEQLTKTIQWETKQRGGDAKSGKIPEKAAVPTEPAAQAPARVPGGPATKKKDWFATDEEEKASGGKGSNYQSSPTSKVSAPLIQKAKQLEGWDGFKAKWDSGQYSIGYGSRATSPHEQITQEEADSRLKSELTMHAGRVDAAAANVGMVLTEGVRSALVLFDYNTGAAEFLIQSSGGNLAEIKRRLPSWNQMEKGQGPHQSLVRRRQAELAMMG